MPNHVYALLSSRTSIRPILFAFLFILLFAATSHAQTPAQDVRTVFTITNQASLFAGTFPLTVWSVDGPTLTWAAELRPNTRGSGPVSLAVDAVHEHVFITVEDSNKLDVVNALSGERLDQITLSGTGDLAGIDVLESRGQLFVVDREEKDIFVFDTVTFNQVDHWVAPAGNGIYDISVEENVDGDDVIFVTDGTQTVRWFDIDSHVLRGSTIFTANCIGMAVDNTRSDPLIFTVAHDPGVDDPYPEDHNFLQRMNLANGQEIRHQMDTSARGLEVNENDRLVYATLGQYSSFPIRLGTVRVFDADSLAELNSYDLDYCPGLLTKCTPTGIAATRLAFGTRFEKELTSHPGGQFNTGEEAIFTVTITNESSSSIRVLPLQDEYDTSHLQYLYSVPASNDNNDDGVINWSNVITSDLGPDASTSVEIHFRAAGDCEDYLDGTNTGTMTGAETAQGNPLPDASDTADYRLVCICLQDSDCNDGQYCNGVEQCLREQCVPGDPPCEDDGDFCNGEETCNEQNDQCGNSGDPCPDDGLYCNGDEVCNEARDRCDSTGDPCLEIYCDAEATCVEATDECISDGTPCLDDGIFCNGDEYCDHDLSDCVHSGDPCGDDELWCNGDESCDEQNDECDHSGDPCPDGEACDETADECVPFDFDDDLDDDDTEIIENTPVDNEEDDAGWPEGKVTGGCCGCG
jgi:hypothetical protein